MNNPYSHDKDVYADGRKCGSLCPACIYAEGQAELAEQITKYQYYEPEPPHLDSLSVIIPISDWEKIFKLAEEK